MADSRARGFTLLEVLIALVIALLAVGALFSGALAGLRSTQISAHYAAALSRARSHLGVIGRSAAISPGEQSGDDGGGYTWQTRIAALATAPAASRDGDEAHAPGVVLYDVAVAISWAMDGGRRTVTLESHRVGMTGPRTP